MHAELQPTSISYLIREMERICPSRGEKARQRRARITEALARCYCLRTDRPHRDWRPMLSFLAEQDRWTSPCYAERIGRKALLRRIKEGGLGIDAELGFWNSGLWHGLRLSGALRRGPPASTEWYAYEAAHRELVADLAELPIPGRLEPKPSPSGLRRLRRCPAAFLPPEDPKSPSVLAGLFAGAVLRQIGGETWMELPVSEEIPTLLKAWGMNFTIAIGKSSGASRKTLVSPFFAALLSSDMPRHSAQRILSIRRAAMCPLLPAVCYELVLSRRFSRYMRASDLPFGLSKAAFMTKRWCRRDLKRIGMVDIGIWMSDGLRKLIVRWFEAHQRQPDPELAQPVSVRGTVPAPGACTVDRLGT